MNLAFDGSGFGLVGLGDISSYRFVWSLNVPPVSEPTWIKSISEMAKIAAHINTEQHALHLFHKLHHKFETAKEVRSQREESQNLGPDDLRDAILRKFADFVRLDFAQVVSVGDDLIHERIDKQFRLEFPDGHLKFDFSWSTEQSKVRSLGVENTESYLIVTGLATGTIFRMNDIETKVDNVALLDVRKVLLRFSGHASQRDAERYIWWFISFLCTHPSNYAFDAVSKILFPQD